VDEHYPKQAEYRDGERERIRNAPRTHIAVGDNRQYTQTNNQDCRLHCSAPAESDLEVKVGKRGYPIPDRHSTRPLWARDFAIKASDGGTDGVEPRVESAAERLRTRGDGKGDKDDKHGILGRGGTTLINAKAIDQSAHFKSLLEVRPGSIASVCQRRFHRPSADEQINRVTVSRLSKPPSEKRLCDLIY
jgi:hypothetical protein